MNKTIKPLIVSALFSVALFNYQPTFAQVGGDAEVLGKVYNCSEVLPYIPVKVTCNETTLNGQTGSTTGDDGKYSVTFRDGACDNGDSVDVQAKVDGNTYSNSGTIGTYFFFFDKAWVDIQTGSDCETDPSVPEFGMLTGLLAGVGSVGSYLLLKKRSAKI